MTTVVVAYPWNADDEMLAPLRERFPDLEIVAQPYLGQFNRYLPDGEDDWVDGTGQPGDIVKARIDYTWDILTPLMQPFFENGQIHLVAESAMKNESRFE